MEIVEYASEYAPKIADTFMAAVHAVDDAHYSKAQKAAWAPHPVDYSSWKSRLDKTKPFLALVSEEVAGFIELRNDGYIDCFYVHPENQGTGVGAALFAHAEMAAISEKMPRLYADVSLAAKRFFLKRGFEILGENRVSRRGQVLVNFTMQRLDSAVSITLCKERSEMPFDLFLTADPAPDIVESYLEGARVYALWRGGQVLCAYILKHDSEQTLEIKNIAVRHEVQRQGFGKLLLAHAIQEARRLGYKELIIGTGNSSIAQLQLYQISGFEPFEIRENFFLQNYPEPIWENGIACKHMIMLRRRL